MAASPQIIKGARLRRGLCRRVVFASLRGRRPFGPRVVVAFGHALAGVRVQRVHKVQRVQRVGVAAVAANNKGARLRRRLCSRVVFASLRGRRPFGPRVVVAPSAQFYRPPFGGHPLPATRDFF